MATRDDGFIREGIQRWGRAQAVLEAFERRLGEEIARIGEAHAPSLRLVGATPGSPRIYGKGIHEASIRVEFTCRFGKKAAELILGVEWGGNELEPSYYAAFYEPKELWDLDGLLSPEERKLGLRIGHEEKRDWATLPVGDRGLDDGFALLLAVLRRKVDSLS